jgi:hypothetical protein
VQISITAQSATDKPKNLCKFQNYTNLPQTNPKLMQISKLHNLPQTNPKLKEFQNSPSDEEKKLLQLE